MFLLLESPLNRFPVRPGSKSSLLGFEGPGNEVCHSCDCGRSVSQLVAVFLKTQDDLSAVVDAIPQTIPHEILLFLGQDDHLFNDKPGHRLCIDLIDILSPGTPGTHKSDRSIFSHPLLELYLSHR